MTGTERKVFQKYYPPDFDPSKIPKAKGGRNRQFVQRVMAPYNMQCNTCHEYIYKGKKFNMRRETAEGEFYLGLRIFRFYFRCPNCLAEISFKTDLENCDYAQEHGATRLFEAFKLYQDKEKEKEEKEEDEKKDPMKMLEKRTKMSRAEMEALGKLEELRELNRRHASMNMDNVIQVNSMETEANRIRRQEREDEAYVQLLFPKTCDGKMVKRLNGESDEEIDVKPNLDDLRNTPSTSASSLKKSICPESKPNLSGSAQKPTAKRATSQRKLLEKSIIVKKKPKIATAQTVEPVKSMGGLSVLGDYSSSEDSG